MKLIIAGSRTVAPVVSDVNIALIEAFESGASWPPSAHVIHLDNVAEVVSGTAAGADQAGECWAEFYSIPIKRFPADWGKHGKAAGPIRNRAMAAYADAALIFWDGESRGSANMIAEMEKLGKPVKVVRVPRKAGGE